MAGIGFALRDLLRRNDLWAIVETHLHGVIVVAGPWFFTIVAMALPSLLFDKSAAAETGPFVTVLLYAFAASLTLTSPIAIALTRHVSDRLYLGSLDDVAASFVGALVLGLSTVPLVALAAATLLDLDGEMLALGVVAYALVTTNWIAAPMLTTVRQFRPLTATYALGTLAFAVYVRAQPSADAAALLAGFDVCVGVTTAAILALVLHNFPGRAWPLFAVVGAFRRYWDLALGGFVYGVGIWADKFLMWTAPEASVIRGGLPAYPMYDTAVFLAYITTVPAMALFIVKSETSFAEACDRLYGAIRRHGDLRRLEVARVGIVRAFFASGRDVMLVQLVVTTLVLLLPTLVLDAVGLPRAGVFMFRFSALGAAFHAAVLMLTIVLYYFDSRRAVLVVHLTFLVANIALTLLALQLGWSFYGIGYFLAALLTFALCYALVQRSFSELLFLAFVQQNEAVRAARARSSASTTWLPAQRGEGPAGWHSLGQGSVVAVAGKGSSAATGAGPR